MTKHRSPMSGTRFPIKCTTCDRLALADMDETPLCAPCLFAALKNGVDGHQLKPIPVFGIPQILAPPHKTPGIQNAQTTAKAVS